MTYKRNIRKILILLINNLQINIRLILQLMRDIFYLICILLIAQSVNTLNCSATHFHYTSKYTLGKQDELNKTFDKIQQKITSLNDVSYNATEAITYTISKVNPSFYYRDSKQKANIKGNDTIVIDGGYVQVDFTFEWQKKFLETQKGTGSGKGLSFEIIFAKKMVIDGGFYSYELLDSMAVTFPETFQITRIDPPDASDADKTILLKMLNSISGKDVRTELQNEIQKYFKLYLSNSLHDEHQPIDLQFDYKWVPTTRGKNNVTISMIRRPITVDIEKEGIQTNFEVQVENDTNWKCGDRNIPISPFDPRTFGGSQQFISYDFYQSVLRYAIEKNILNTELNKQNWENRMFQFYVGDLYEVFPALREKYYAIQAVEGSCQPTYDKLRVQNAGNNTFSVYIHFDCSLYIAQKEKLVDFGVDLNLTIAGHPAQSSIDFKASKHTQTTKFFPYGQYRIDNEDLAQKMVEHSLNRLYEGRLFGSGYPLYPARDYPEFTTQTNFTVVYDSTHVNSFKS